MKVERKLTKRKKIETSERDRERRNVKGKNTMKNSYLFSVLRITAFYRQMAMVQTIISKADAIDVRFEMEYCDGISATTEVDEKQK